jgi:hypothetical protein
MKSFTVQIRFNARIQKLTVKAKDESSAIESARQFMYPLYDFEILKVTKK